MDQFYIEEGYIDASYYGIVAEAQAVLGGAFTPSFTVDIADPSGYYIPDYIDADYFVAPGQIVEAVGAFQVISGVDSAVGKIVEADANFEAFAGSTLVADALKNHTAILDALVDMLATVSKIASNTVTLDSIINQSLQGDRVRFVSVAPYVLTTQDTNSTALRDSTATLDSAFSLNSTIGFVKEFNANLDITFSQVSNGYIAERTTNWINNTAPAFDNISLDNISKFGTGSLLKNNISDEIAPQQAPLWTGSQWIIVNENYTWISTDLQDWTRYTNDLVNVSYSVYDIKFINNQIVISLFNEFAVSTDGITWTRITPVLDQYYTPNIRSIIYQNGKWLIESYNSTQGRWGIFSANSLSTTGWTLIYSLARTTGSGSPQTTNQFRDLTSDGTTAAFGVYSYTYYGQFTNTIRKITGTTNSFSTLAVTANTNEYLNEVYAFDNNAYYTVTGADGTTDTKLKLGSTTLLTRPEQLSSFGKINNLYYYYYDGKTYTGSSISSATLETEFDNAKDSAFAYANGYYTVIDQDELFYSTNGTTWDRQVVDFSESINLRGVDYNNTDIANWQTIDFWFKGQNGAGHPFNNNFFNMFKFGDVSSVLFKFPDSVSGQIRLVNTGLATASYSPTLTDVFSNWNHFRFLKNGTSVKVYVNGIAVLTFTPTTSFGSDTISVLAGTSASGAADCWIDELLVSKSQLNTFADDTFTVPSEQWSNTTDTALLLHFNNDFADDSEPPLRVYSTVVSTVDVSVDVIRDVTTSVEIVSTTVINVSQISETTEI